MRVIGGKFSGRILAKPLGLSIRPTTDRTRESLFNILTSREENFWVNRRVLDLFAGTGALGIEALSRGAKTAVFVENTIEGRSLIQKNIETLGLQGVGRILRRDATKLGNIGTMLPFDVIFADPPYGFSLGEKAFIQALKGGWAKTETLFILEEAKEAIINLPDPFYLDDERFYSDTVIRIYRLQQ
ncbi:16S rRNA (guanine966-N2)-methyltransferase [Bartonella sp. CDC_skunk]|uniref:Putative enzyme n=1 Tax=Bartonella rochalimae ATCC BAA-1498 TaxID=685782 RepID=E6YK71_9HYPH|nr:MULTISPECIES: 16S rRNA (guanine(966)-N(2))-methyltransferase RsmD [Bartonella]AQX17924.1 16S rRNA (guanine966-N2)-methyltransferase [Bartonella sp. A1379B]AQX20845.1 16S rRNA (guanine966-N2)-methyltransferase [Bartonella sp. CDC_skunk]AQX22437.1 16S rRNA (guanine966-N2)-methyltransferase [Bartonella sp. 11B]AQX24282.1 16S rRNA (guanine966-N2)-methyltransferase [Bartonella sp. 114]AQX24885.1 16S rRNA (guanine966-N2)-methyltransferase [Bartonella sp. Coyote22sub2]